MRFLGFYGRNMEEFVAVDYKSPGVLQVEFNGLFGGGLGTQEW